jgi:hypothetical protein
MREDSPLQLSQVVIAACDSIPPFQTRALGCSMVLKVLDGPDMEAAVRYHASAPESYLPLAAYRDIVRLLPERPIRDPELWDLVNRLRALRHGENGSLYHPLISGPRLGSLANTACFCATVAGELAWHNHMYGSGCGGAHCDLRIDGIVAEMVYSVIQIGPLSPSKYRIGKFWAPQPQILAGSRPSDSADAARYEAESLEFSSILAPLGEMARGNSIERAIIAATNLMHELEASGTSICRLAGGGVALVDGLPTDGVALDGGPLEYDLICTLDGFRLSGMLGRLSDRGGMGDCVVPAACAPGSTGRMG